MDQPDWRILQQGVDELGHGAIKVVMLDSPDFEEYQYLTVTEVKVEGDDILIVVE